MKESMRRTKAHTRRETRAAWVAAALGAVLAGAAPASAERPAIPAMTLARAELVEVGEHHHRLVLAAEGVEGARLDAFGVRVERRPPGPIETTGYDLPGPPLPGFYRHRSRDGQDPVELEMLAAHPDGRADSRLRDNGPLDEDPIEGTFAYTFDTREWEDGEYVFLVSASGSVPDGGAARAARHFVRLLIGNVEPAEARVNVPGAEHRVIYKQEGIYAAFPRLHTLPDGRIAIAHATRVYRSHIDETGGSAHWVSPDEGLTWEPLTEPLIDRIWLTSDGRVVLPQSEGWIFVDASREEELRAAGKRIHSRPTQAGQIAYIGGARVRTSTDGGRTWTYQSIPLPEDPPLGVSGYSTAASYLATESGVRLRAMYGSRRHPDDPDATRPSEIYFLRSEDDGETWTFRAMRPEGLPGDHPGLNETALVQIPSGRLLAMSRSYSDAFRDDHLWQSESDDEGLTWTAPVRTDIRGYPAHVIVLEDGRLLCAYGTRSDPMGIRAVTSSDEGRTWDLENELILRADGLGHRGDNGMPLLHQRADGSVIAIYYLTTMDAITHIASTLFRAP